MACAVHRVDIAERTVCKQFSSLLGLRATIFIWKPMDALAGMQWGYDDLIETLVKSNPSNITGNVTELFQISHENYNTFRNPWIHELLVMFGCPHNLPDKNPMDISICNSPFKCNSILKIPITMVKKVDYLPQCGAKNSNWKDVVVFENNNRHFLADLTRDW